MVKQLKLRFITTSRMWKNIPYIIILEQEHKIKNHEINRNQKSQIQTIEPRNELKWQWTLAREIPLVMVGARLGHGWGMIEAWIH